VRHSLALHYAGQSDFAGAARVLAGMRYAGQDSVLRAREEILAGVLELLQDRFGPAREALLKAARNHAGTPGAPFQALVHARVAVSLSGESVLTPLDNALFVNDAVSRRERLFLAYLGGRFDPEGLRNALPPESPSLPSLEEALVEYLRALETGKAAAATLLHSARARFPAATFESVYLDFLLSRLGAESSLD
jgi:hypothetical protein